MSPQNTVTKPQDLVNPRIASYFMSSWYARWIIIGVVASSFLFLTGINRQVVGGLIGLATAYNGFLWLGSKKHWTAITDQRVMLAIDSLLSVVLVLCTNGIDSPYLLVLVLVVVSGAFWYGLKVSVTISILLAAALLAQNISQNNNVLPKNLIVQMLILATVGVYVSWLTRSERSERNKLVVLGTATENERQQLLALINNMRDAVMVVDNDDRITIYNQAAAALAGNTDNLRGASLGQAIQLLDNDSRPVELKMKHAKEVSERKDLHAKAPDDSLVNVAISIAPYIVDRQNHGHVLIIRDTTQEKTIDKEREEFIAVASHELRTPLTIAQGDISFLLSPPYLPKNPESVEMLNGALRSLQQLSHIISDLTNLSEVENERLDVHLEPLNPVALLHDFESDYRDQAKSKGLELQVSVDPELSSATILTSRYVVREILSIYISNALKFTEKGVVTLKVMNPKDGEPGVMFSVADTGIGISHSDQKKIFEKFFQSEEYSTRIHGGTGLGLYIARSLAARITARVWFETDLNKGSTFYLWVPPYSRHEQDRGKVAAAETKDFFSTV